MTTMVSASPEKEIVTQLQTVVLAILTYVVLVGAVVASAAGAVIFLMAHNLIAAAGLTAVTVLGSRSVFKM